MCQILLRRVLCYENLGSGLKLSIRFIGRPLSRHDILHPVSQKKRGAFGEL